MVSFHRRQLSQITLPDSSKAEERMIMLDTFPRGYVNGHFVIEMQELNFLRNSPRV